MSSDNSSEQRPSNALFKELKPKASSIKGKTNAPKGNRRTANPYGDAAEERERQARMKSLVSMIESVNLGGNNFELNSRVSHKVVSLYESLNATNKRKMLAMMKESEEGLNKIISFAVRQ